MATEEERAAEELARLELQELEALELQRATTGAQLGLEQTMLENAMGRPDIQNSWYANPIVAGSAELLRSGGELLGGALGGLGGAALGTLAGPVGTYFGGIGGGTGGAAYGRLRGKELAEGLSLAPSTDLISYKSDGGIDLSPTPVTELIGEALDPNRISLSEFKADLPNMALDTAAGAAFGLLPLGSAIKNWKWPQAAPASDLADPSVQAGIRIMERNNATAPGEVAGQLTYISPNTAAQVALQNQSAGNLVDSIAAQLGADAGASSTEKALAFNFKQGAQKLIDGNFFDDVNNISELSGKAGTWKTNLIKARDEVLNTIDAGIRNASGTTGSIADMPPGARITPEDLAPHLQELNARASNLNLNDLSAEMGAQIKNTLGSLLNDVGRTITTPRTLVQMNQNLNAVRRNLLKEFDFANIARGQVGNTQSTAQLEASLEAISKFQEGIGLVLQNKLGQLKGAGVIDVDPRFFSEWNQLYGALDATEDLSTKALQDISQAQAVKSATRIVQNQNVPQMVRPSAMSTIGGAIRGGIDFMTSPVGGITPGTEYQQYVAARSQNALSNIKDLLFLNKRPAQLGPAPGPLGASGLYPAATGAMGGRPIDFLSGTAQAREPETETFSAPRPVQMNLNPIPPAPKQGFQLPRNLNELDPQGVSNMIGAMLPPEIAEPLLIQWKKVSLGGSKEQMAEFLGLLVDRYPDFPIQRGPITGLNSEFDIGDGKMKLFSFNDKVKWEEQINNSSLEVDERAQRVMALRKSGVVVPMNVKLAPPPPAPIEPENRAMMYLQQTHSFSPRDESGYGNRRVE